MGRQFRLGGEIPEDVRSLAYIGDAVCHLYIRQRLVGQGGNVSGLTKKASAFASAQGQARAAETLRPSLTEEEDEVFRRGRNAKCGVVPRNCDPVDYRKATGIEALMGWLYVVGNRERLEELLAMAYSRKDKNE